MSSFSTSSFVDSVCSLIVSFVLYGTPPWILIEPRRCFIERKVNTPLCGTVKVEDEDLNRLSYLLYRNSTEHPPDKM